MPRDNKIVIIGNSGVGKSTMMMWLTHNKFMGHLEPTIGASFCIKEMNVKGEKVKLHIWDTAGQERFRSISSIYYRDSIGCLCVFDVTNRESFEALGEWLKDYEKLTEFPHGIIIVANKCDAPLPKWKVTKQEIENFILEYQHELIYTNCISGENVIKTFQRLSELVLDVRKDMLNFDDFHDDKYLGILDLQAEKWFNGGDNNTNSYCQC